MYGRDGEFAGTNDSMSLLPDRKIVLILVYLTSLPYYESTQYKNNDGPAYVGKHVMLGDITQNCVLMQRCKYKELSHGRHLCLNEGDWNFIG